MRINHEGIHLKFEKRPAYRSKKEKHEMSLFGRFATEGNESADELAKDGALLDGGEMAQIRASTIQQKREEVYAALQYAADFSLFGGGVAGL